MAVELITGTSGSALTDAAIEKIGSIEPALWANKLRCIVPTVEIAEQLELEIMRRFGLSGMLGNCVCTFYGFAREIITRQGLASGLISDIQKNLMLDSLIESMGLEYFAESAEYPGFLTALDQAIGELKTSLIDPQTFADALAHSEGRLYPSSKLKLNELARIYRHYQDDILVKHNLLDREGLMWLALELARESGVLRGLNKVLFYGFYNLNEIQNSFISLVARQVEGVSVVFRYDQNRQEVFERLHESVTLLQNLPGASHRALADAGEVGSGLEHLQRCIFTKTLDKFTPDESVQVIKAGSPSIEVELVAEQITKLLEDKNISYSDILITGNNLGDYRSLLERTFEEYNIPIEPARKPAAESEMVDLLTCCCKLILGNWRRDDVYRIANHEMLGSDLTQACKMQVDASQLGIGQGKENWLKPWPGEDSTREFRCQILRIAADFEDALNSAGSVAQYSDVVLRFIANLKYDSFDPKSADENNAARKTIEQVLTDIVNALSLSGSRIDLRGFLRTLQSTLSAAEIKTDNDLPDYVCVQPAGSVLGQQYAAVFVLGMLQRVLPKQMHEDAFIRDSERVLLGAHLGNKLKRRLTDDGADRNMFYRLVAAASSALYLSYPISDESGKDTVRSVYIEEVEQRFDTQPVQIERDVTGFIPEINLARSERMLHRCLVRDFAEKPQNDSPDAVAVYNLIVQAQGSLFARVFSDFAERPAQLSDARVLRDLIENKRKYRCTELESYAVCPFLYFCRHILEIEPISAQVSALDIGSLLHTVLRRLFSELSREHRRELKIDNLDTEDTIRRADLILKEEFERLAKLSNMPEYKKWPLISMLSWYLHTYITREIKDGWKDYSPTYFELEFGLGAMKGRVRDIASVADPLTIPGEDGKTIKLCGKIDRVDLYGDKALVMDYKLGSSTSVGKYKEGITLQVFLYAMAMEQLFGHTAAGAEYRALRKWSVRGLYSKSAGIPARSTNLKEDEEFKEVLAECAVVAADIVRNIEAGRIAVEPQDCRTYCSYRAVCRKDAR